MTPTTESPSSLRLRRSGDRPLQDLGWSKNRLTFSFAEYHDPDWMGFGPLRVLIESRIDPHEGFSKHPHRNVEIASYVTDGALRHRDSFGHASTLTEGEMQLISAGRRGMIHSENNPTDEPERHYQIWLRPSRSDTDFDYHEVGFAPEERKGRFRLYVSPDGRGRSMPVNADAYISVGRFAAGETASYELAERRGAWLQVIDGRMEVENTSLRQGDGVGITGMENINFSFRAPSEVLIVDVRMREAPSARITG